MAENPLPTHWDENVDYLNLPRVRTGIPFTPRILAAMLVGGNAMGINWAAKFAKISETEIPENALKPIVNREYRKLDGEGLLTFLLPADILGDLTETQTISDVRDGEWIPEVLEVVTGRLIANEGQENEYIYERCDELLTGADVTTLFFDANFVIHFMAMDRIDDMVFSRAIKYCRKFADEDPVGSLFSLFLLSLLGPEHFNAVVKAMES